MKKKSIKSENGVSPESKVIKKMKKVVNLSALTTDSAPAVEPVVKIETEIKLESAEIETETGAITEVKSGKGMDTDEGEKNSPEEEPSKAAKRKEYTIFVANLPTTITKSQLKALFTKYGTIETVRTRTNDGQKIHFKQDLAHVLAINGYVRFSTKEEMEKACEMNGQLVGENRIRVCPQSKKQFGDVKSTVFVGNIKRGTTENDLYDFFSRAGPIEFVRLIAQKYFAYVCFKKGVSMKKVLKLDQEKLNNRPLRIQLVDTQRTNVKLNKKGNVVKRRKFPPKQKDKDGTTAKANETNDSAQDNFHGNVSEAKKKNNKRSKSGVGSAKHKKMLASKLKAAMNV